MIASDSSQVKKVWSQTATWKIQLDLRMNSKHNAAQAQIDLGGCGVFQNKLVITNGLGRADPAILQGYGLVSL